MRYFNISHQGAKLLIMQFSIISLEFDVHKYLENDEGLKHFVNSENVRN